MNRWKLCVGIFLVFFTASCAQRQAYEVENIKKEYAQPACRAEIRPETERVTAPGAGEEAPAGTFTLPEAVATALVNNPDNRMALTRIAQAEAMTQRADAAFMPGARLYFEYSQGDAPSSYLFKTIDTRKFDPSTDFNSPGWFENYEAGLGAWFNLYNGGRDMLGKRISEADLEISEIEKDSVENRLIASVIRTYYDVLAAEEYIRIAEESAETVKAQLRIMEIRFRGGDALKSDILTLKVRNAEAEEEVVRSRNRLKTVAAAFANILGICPDTPVVLSPPGKNVIAVHENYSEGGVYAFEKRPELKKIRKEMVKARMAVDMARSTYFPTVDLQGKYYYDDPDMKYDRDRENWMMAVVVNQDIFTGFSTGADLRRAESQLEELIAAEAKTQLDIRLDVKTSYLGLREAVARLNVAENSVDMARESYGLVKRQYEGGSADITRYLNAELDLSRARMRKTSAYYDREKALADIARATGMLLDTFHYEGQSPR